MTLKFNNTLSALHIFVLCTIISTKNSIAMLNIKNTSRSITIKNLLSYDIRILRKISLPEINGFQSVPTGMITSSIIEPNKERTLPVSYKNNTMHFNLLLIHNELIPIYLKKTEKNIIIQHCASNNQVMITDKNNKILGYLQ